MINTPHINQLGEIAETILLPGDPLRAKMIAEKYLENPVCFNRIRGALGFTGEYKGHKISVMGTGMGMPSMGIYSHELINIFGVKNLIRIGSAGALQKRINVRDIVIALSASTNSVFGSQFGLKGSFAPTADFDLAKTAAELCSYKNIPYHVGNILTSDTFYTDDMTANEGWKKMGVLCVEMETAALYYNAARYGAKALSILTISDHLAKEAPDTSARERETSFLDMIETALETVIKIKG